MTKEDDKRIGDKAKLDFAWQKRAEENNWRCKICGALIIYEDKDVYYLTDMCGLCDHRAGKDE